MTSGRHGLFSVDKKDSDAGASENDHAPLPEGRYLLSRKLSFQGTSGTVFDSEDIEEQVKSELGPETAILALFEMHGLHKSEIPVEFERIPQGRARIRVSCYKEEMVSKSRRNPAGQRVILVAVDRQLAEEISPSDQNDGEGDAGERIHFSTAFYGRMAELQALDNEKRFELAFRQVAAYIHTLPAEGKGHSVCIALRGLDAQADFVFLVMLAACCIYKLGSFSVDGEEALTQRLHAAVTEIFPTMDVFTALEASVTADIYRKVEATTDSLLDAVNSGLTTKGVIGQAMGLESILSSATATDTTHANSSSSSSAPARVVEVTSWTVLAVVSQFLRGGVSFHEAWRAYRDRRDPDRKVKMGTALFSGAVSFGSGIVSALYLGHVGLLATAGALTLTPIVLTSISIGVYLVVLLRDLYLLRSLNRQIATMGAPRNLDKASMRKLKKLEMDRTELRAKMKTDVMLMVGVSLTLAALLVGTILTGGVLPLALSIIGGSLVASLVIVRVGEKLWSRLRNSRLLSSLGRRATAEIHGGCDPRPNSLSPPLAAMIANEQVNNPTLPPNPQMNFQEREVLLSRTVPPVSMQEEKLTEEDPQAPAPSPGGKR